MQFSTIRICCIVRDMFLQTAILCDAKRINVKMHIAQLRKALGDDTALQFVSQMQMNHSLRLQPARQKWEGDRKGKWTL